GYIGRRKVVRIEGAEVVPEISRVGGELAEVEFVRRVVRLVAEIALEVCERDGGIGESDVSAEREADLPPVVRELLVFEADLLEIRDAPIDVAEAVHCG